MSPVTRNSSVISQLRPQDSTHTCLAKLLPFLQLCLGKCVYGKPPQTNWKVYQRHPFASTKPSPRLVWCDGFVLEREFLLLYLLITHLYRRGMKDPRRFVNVNDGRMARIHLQVLLPLSILALSQFIFETGNEREP